MMRGMLGVVPSLMQRVEAPSTLREAVQNDDVKSAQKAYFTLIRAYGFKHTMRRIRLDLDIRDRLSPRMKRALVLTALDHPDCSGEVWDTLLKLNS